MSNGPCDARSLSCRASHVPAQPFRKSRKSSLGLQPAVGNTIPHVLSAFAFVAFNSSPASKGSHVSCMPLAVHPRSGLWLTLTVLAAKFTSGQYAYITSVRDLVVGRTVAEKRNGDRAVNRALPLKSLSRSTVDWLPCSRKP
jgi:hypothetical protein